MIQAGDRLGEEKLCEKKHQGWCWRTASCVWAHRTAWQHSPTPFSVTWTGAEPVAREKLSPPLAQGLECIQFRADLPSLLTWDSTVQDRQQQMGGSSAEDHLDNWELRTLALWGEAEEDRLLQPREEMVVVVVGNLINSSLSRPMRKLPRHNQALHSSAWWQHERQRV